MKVKSLSRVRLFATPWTAAHQAPLPVGFSRQEYWSGVPLPSPFHCRGTWFLSLVRELRSHRLQGVAKQKKKITIYLHDFPWGSLELEAGEAKYTA